MTGGRDAEIAGGQVGRTADEERRGQFEAASDGQGSERSRAEEDSESGDPDDDRQADAGDCHQEEGRYGRSRSSSYIFHLLEMLEFSLNLTNLNDLGGTGRDRCTAGGEGHQEAALGRAAIVGQSASGCQDGAGGHLPAPGRRGRRLEDDPLHHRAREFHIDHRQLFDGRHQRQCPRHDDQQISQQSRFQLRESQSGQCGLRTAR